MDKPLLLQQDIFKLERLMEMEARSQADPNSKPARANLQRLNAYLAAQAFGPNSSSLLLRLDVTQELFLAAAVLR